MVSLILGDILGESDLLDDLLGDLQVTLSQLSRHSKIAYRDPETLYHCSGNEEDASV